MTDTPGIRVVRVPSGIRPIEEVLIDPSLESLQAEVGGYIEQVRLTEWLHLWLNEDGIALGLPLNARASVLAGQAIFGDTIIAGDDPAIRDGDEHDVAPGTGDLIGRIMASLYANVQVVTEDDVRDAERAAAEKAEG